jgi:hypothetical protein
VSARARGRSPHPAAADPHDDAHDRRGPRADGAALGVGTEANQPLAIAVIGGLLVSTFFTLVLIPTLYVILEERFPRAIAEPEDAAA